MARLWGGHAPCVHAHEDNGDAYACTSDIDNGAAIWTMNDAPHLAAVRMPDLSARMVISAMATTGDDDDDGGWR